ncbi:hypothetical protein AVEN_20101-1 [Araneus ventricosus]|uniref:Uncharacterized protein n=1 Tax=Araneus ventricosus TaxID=182803 RepID=A0A4Y2M3R1_ARAVE|nr:hypothetical protein AVEN_20101-1 [Araneus ventricosus]
MFAHLSHLRSEMHDMMWYIKACIYSLESRTYSEPFASNWFVGKKGIISIGRKVLEAFEAIQILSVFRRIYSQFTMEHYSCLSLFTNLPSVGAFVRRACVERHISSIPRSAAK